MVAVGPYEVIPKVMMMILLSARTLQRMTSPIFEDSALRDNPIGLISLSLQGDSAPLAPPTPNQVDVKSV